MTDHRARRGVPDHWLLPPAPLEPELARRWADLAFDRRRALARTRVQELGTLSDADGELVVGLASARLATRVRLFAMGPVLGWMVLMTVWGFGRSTYPRDADTWLVAGLSAGAVAWTVASLRAAATLRRARAVLASAQAREGGDRDDGGRDDVGGVR